MKTFGLKSLFLILLVASIIMLVTLKCLPREYSLGEIEGLSPRDKLVRIMQINGSEAIIVVGSGVQVKISLEVNGKEISSEKLSQGRRMIKIFWGGAENQFGFFVNGRIHSIPISLPFSNNSLGARLTVGGTQTMATIHDDKKNEWFRVIVYVRSDNF